MTGVGKERKKRFSWRGGEKESNYGDSVLERKENKKFDGVVEKRKATIMTCVGDKRK